MQISPRFRQIFQELKTEQTVEGRAPSVELTAEQAAEMDGGQVAIDAFVEGDNNERDQNPALGIFERTEVVNGQRTTYRSEMVETKEETVIESVYNNLDTKWVSTTRHEIDDNGIITLQRSGAIDGEFTNAAAYFQKDEGKFLLFGLE
jgi:hypothetical protein